MFVFVQTQKCILFKDEDEKKNATKQEKATTEDTHKNDPLSKAITATPLIIINKADAVDK